jgi:hypothetical protein
MGMFADDLLDRDQINAEVFDKGERLKGFNIPLFEVGEYGVMLDEARYKAHEADLRAMQEAISKASDEYLEELYAAAQRQDIEGLKAVIRNVSDLDNNQIDDILELEFKVVKLDDDREKELFGQYIDLVEGNADGLFQEREDTSTYADQFVNGDTSKVYEDRATHDIFGKMKELQTELGIDSEIGVNAASGFDVFTKMVGYEKEVRAREEDKEMAEALQERDDAKQVLEQDLGIAPEVIENELPTELLDPSLLERPDEELIPADMSKEIELNLEAQREYEKMMGYKPITEEDLEAMEAFYSQGLDQMEPPIEIDEISDAELIDLIDELNKLDSSNE